MSVLTSAEDQLPPIDLALEDVLDALDPLRHYFNSYNKSHLNQTDLLIPLQPSSAAKEIVELSFGVKSTNTHCLPIAPISINLAVDASPGCGGVTWPAGQVNSFFSGHNV
jgi:hypothetical protein